MNAYLSICIPTYNRCEQAVSLVNGILSYPHQDIQVVVLDNASTDASQEAFHAIHDPRLVYSRNKQNLGWHANILGSLLRGTGIYSVLLLDKDFLDPYGLVNFIMFLKEVGPVSGFCDYPVSNNLESLIFNPGLESLLKTAYQCHHPTGHFFRAKEITALDCLNRFTNPDTVGLFPLEFVMAEAAVIGRTAIYRQPLFHTEQLDTSETEKINFIKKSNHIMTADTAFFAPKARTRLIISFLDHLETLPIDFVDKTLVTAKLFLQGLRQSTIEYKNKISNEIVCSHYGIASDVPKSSQLILIGMRYVKDILCKIACKLVFRSL